MAGPVAIREYFDTAYSSSGQDTIVLGGVLVSDTRGSAVKTCTPVVSPGVDVTLDPGTKFVVLENQGGTTVRYAVRPSGQVTQQIASANHPFIPAGATVVESVPANGIINFTG